MTQFSRAAWSDQFNTPTIDVLRGDLLDTAVPLFDQARAMFLGFDEIIESVRWFGDCWHWTIEFALEDHHEDDSLGIIIPSPEDLQVAIPLKDEFHTTVSVKRMKRTMRDGFELATEPFHTSWAVWSLGSSGLVSDIGHLTKQKLKWRTRGCL